jgi:hypothetical protein
LATFSGHAKKLQRPSTLRPRGPQPYKTLNEAHSGITGQIIVPVKFHGHTLNALIDSGAQESYISPKAAERFQIPWKYKLKSYKLRTVDGSHSTYDGGRVLRETSKLSLQVNNHTEEISLDISDIAHHDMILGMSWLQNSNPTINWKTQEITWPETKENINEENIYLIINEARPDDPLAKVPPEYHKFKKLFEEQSRNKLPEHNQWDHRIPIKEGHHPKLHQIYHMNPAKAKALHKSIQKDLARGYITESSSPAGYPVIMVPKMKDGKQVLDKDGDPSFRRVHDYRQLNDITIKNGYPLSLTITMKENISKAQWFTALDLPDGYYLIRMAIGEEWKTAFRTMFGHYEYRVMPQGLTNAPASFQHMINTILREYLNKFVFVYLDDILIYSNTLEEHKKHVALVLKTLQHHKLLVNAAKSVWHTQKLDFLGFTITPGHIQIQDSKIEAVKNWPIPEKANITTVRQFLGFVNYVRPLIKDFGKVAGPIQKLTTKEYKNTEFALSPEAQEAWKQLKELVTSKPVMKLPSPDKPKRLKTDASDYALGAVLEQQEPNGKWYPVAYYSKTLTGAPSRYPIYDKELLAIINALKEWEPFLSGIKEPFAIYSDHKNLTRFMTTQEMTRRHEHWISYLARFNFKIHHIKGKENIQADILSRRGDYDPKISKRQKTVFIPTKDGSLALNAILQRPTEEQLATIRNSYNIQEKQEVRNLQGSNQAQLVYHGKIYISEEDQERFIKEFHEHPLHGHQGVYKTMKRLRKQYDFPGLPAKVKKVIKNCNICNKAKAARHKPYGLLQPTEIPDHAWRIISWDFITGLPTSTDPVSQTQYNGIWVITDRLTKYAYFYPFRDDTTSEQFAYAFVRQYLDKHGIPERIVSDRDKLFTSKFSTTFFRLIGTKAKMSTAFHPQTDGQTERMNQTLEQYLRSYVNYQQDNWVELLPLAQIAYNTSDNEDMNMSPHEAVYGRSIERVQTEQISPANNSTSTPTSIAPRAEVVATEIRTIQARLQTELQFVQERMTRYYNKKRIEGPTFHKGDKVYLLRQKQNATSNISQIKTKRPNDKLDFKKLGPYEIEEVISKTNYRLALPGKTRRHPVFHISLLEPAPANAPLETSEEIHEDQEEYDVEEILDSRQNGRKFEYLVKWEGYPPEDNTWEPMAHLKTAPQKVALFHQRYPDRPKPVVRGRPPTAKANSTRPSRTRGR